MAGPEEERLGEWLGMSCSHSAGEAMAQKSVWSSILTLESLARWVFMLDPAPMMVPTCYMGTSRDSCIKRGRTSGGVNPTVMRSTDRI
jgi:hypothetical protein